MEDKISKGGNYKRFKKESKREHGNLGPENFVHSTFKISGSAPGEPKNVTILAQVLIQIFFFFFFFFFFTISFMAKMPKSEKGHTLVKYLHNFQFIVIIY